MLDKSNVFGTSIWCIQHCVNVPCNVFADETQRRSGPLTGRDICIALTL